MAAPPPTSPPSLLVAGLWMTCAACPGPQVSTPGGTDRDTYAALLADGTSDPAALLDRCATIRDADLAGDCALVLAMRTAGQRKEPIANYCPRVPEGTWRHECWFMAAERARRDGDEAVAADLCTRAGPFVDDCGQHLWQTAVRTQARRHAGAPLVTLLEEAGRIHDAWSPLLAGSTDFEERFWSRVFQNAWEVRPVIDPTACDDLVPTQATRCRMAAAYTWSQRLDRLLGPFELRAPRCTLLSTATRVPDLALLSPDLAAPSHPTLEAARQEATRRWCTTPQAPVPLPGVPPEGDDTLQQPQVLQDGAVP